MSAFAQRQQLLQDLAGALTKKTSGSAAYYTCTLQRKQVGGSLPENAHCNPNQYFCYLGSVGTPEDSTAAKMRASKVATCICGLHYAAGQQTSNRSHWLLQLCACCRSVRLGVSGASQFLTEQM